MLDPVQKPSDISTNLKNGLDHIINSSAHLDKCIIKIEAAALNSIRKSLSETASIEFCITPSKPSFLATKFLFIG